MDEWGVYDPQQAGIAALVARLDARELKAAAALAAPSAKNESDDASAPSVTTPGDPQS